MPNRREPGKPDALGQRWSIVFLQRHRQGDADESVPGATFLEACPPGVRANLVAILKAVTQAPPPRFAGGLRWQAMHGDMAGFDEARAMGPGKRLYRVFASSNARRRGCLVRASSSSPVSKSQTRRPSRKPTTAASANWATSTERGRPAASRAEQGWVRRRPQVERLAAAGPAASAG